MIYTLSFLFGEAWWTAEAGACPISPESSVTMSPEVRSSEAAGVEEWSRLFRCVLLPCAQKPIRAGLTTAKQHMPSR